MRPKVWGMGLVFVLGLGLASALTAKGSLVVETDKGTADAMEEDSGTVLEDGMGPSRFGADEDDAYTDDSASLDDLARSKFKDEKDEDDRDLDLSDKDEP